MKLKNQALRTGIRAAAFLLLLGLLFGVVEKVLYFNKTTEESANGIAKEPKDSLDAVFIGASDASVPWMGPMAWHKYGIVTRPCCVAGLLTIARPYYVERVRKIQPDALYVITVQPYDMPATVPAVHASIDHFPPSLLKLRMIKDLADAGGYSAKERVSFYIPFIQYHTKWLKLNGPFSRLFPNIQASAGDQTEDDAKNKYDFAMAKEPETAGRKGTVSTEEPFLYKTQDMTGQYHQTERRAILTDECRDFWNGFLDDLDANGSRALFIIPPQCRNMEDVMEFNSVGDLISSRGYPVLNIIDKFDEIGLDLKTDFYDNMHPNVHGAILYTDYVARYLVENYGFADKRGQPGYESWDKAYELVSGDIMAELSEEEIAMIQ